jgi:hypothetical protein
VVLCLRLCLLACPGVLWCLDGALVGASGHKVMSGALDAVAVAAQWLGWRCLTRIVGCAGGAELPRWAAAGPGGGPQGEEAKVQGQGHHLQVQRWVKSRNSNRHIKIQKGLSVRLRGREPYLGIQLGCRLRISNSGWAWRGARAGDGKGSCRAWSPGGALSTLCSCRGVVGGQVQEVARAAGAEGGAVRPAPGLVRRGDRCRART